MGSSIRLHCQLLGRGYVTLKQVLYVCCIIVHYPLEPKIVSSPQQNLDSRSNLSRSSLYASDSSQTTPNPRTLRAQKRNRSEDSGSQASFSSPPSSPVFVPSKKRQVMMLDSDSSYYDSELEEGSTSLFQSRDSEEPLAKEEPKRELRKKASKRVRSASSDSDMSSTPVSSRKKKKVQDQAREAYPLRNSSQQMAPVIEQPEQTNSTSEELPSGNKPPSPHLQPVPESVGDGGDKAEGAVATEPVKQGGGGLSKKEKDMAVASRTRAQTKFENVRVSVNTHIRTCVHIHTYSKLNPRLCCF